MTTEMTEAQRELEDARREREELDSLIEGLEAQVRAGETVAAERQLAERYGVQRLARLRQEAAEQRVRDAEAAALAERRRQAEAAAQADLEILGVDRLAEALGVAVNALAELQRLGDARQAALDRHARAFLDLGMDGKIRHRDGGWVVFEAGGERYDTRQDGCKGARLVELAREELARRGQNAQRAAKGRGPLAPLPHAVARHLAERTGAAA
ncbi:hypothetical protein [Streptomyces phaeoluteigriseus]|uniref:hypothetical protein n=1 Tax=Streptomyces phaeoluteigriseus TaxID=114686 RepID=UPI0036B5238C